MRSRLFPLAALAAALACGAPDWAQSAAAAGEAAVPAPVYTQGEFRSLSQEDGGQRVYAHIKVAPGRKIPFSTLTYRVLDRQLLAGIAPGTRVEFRAERRDGENVLLAIRRSAQ